MTLKVLGRVTSINVRKVLWAADEMGLSYEREDWGLPIRDPNVPEFLVLNPNGQVPVLLDGNFVLWESTAIMLYLAETYGQGAWLPKTPEARARVNQGLGWQASEMPGVWGYAVQALMRKTPGYDDPRRIDQSIMAWESKMAVLEGHLAQSGQPYVAGETFTLADIAVGLAVHRWFGTPFEKQALPVVTDYYGRLKERKAGARWMGLSTP